MHMLLHKILKSRGFLALLAVAIFASTLLGQDQPPSRVDIFTGYSWLHPGYDTYVPTAQENIDKGFTVSGTYFFNRNVGLTVDSGNHFGCCCPRIYTVEAGPTIRFPSEHATPFLHVLAGLHRMELPTPFGDDNNFGFIVGGGLDVPIVHHLSLRLFQVDYEWARHNFGTFLQPRLNGVRLSAGLVWQFGSIGPPPLPASASCSVQPTEVLAGDPVTANASGSNFNPKRTVSYEWTTNGGKVEGTGNTVTVNTAGLAPGSYVVGARLSDNGRGKHQMSASCNSSFTVKEPPKPAPVPPVMSCSAMPTTVRAGDPVTVTAQASSPDGRPLSYEWTTSAGRVSGSGATVTLDTAGLSAGPVTVNGTVTDDRGLSASCSTGATVEVPPPPPEASKINSIAFPDKRRPARVDNTAKAILDEVALRLQRDTDSTAVVVGYAGDDEVTPKPKHARAKLTAEELAGQRAVNTKEYLTKEKGIDPGRIKLATGTSQDATAEIWIVPQGATFNVEGTQPFDDSK